MNNRKSFIESLFLLLFGLLVGMVVMSGFMRRNGDTKPNAVPSPTASISAEITPSVPASPSPTVKVLSFAEMNKIYGPCAQVHVFMYHHIKDRAKAVKEGHGSLTVDTGAFRKHLEYLKDNNFNYVTPSDLMDFFDRGKPLPSKPVILTFDDGYDDNYTDAYPIMRELGAKGVIFIPTGLMNNPGYLTWENILEMQGTGVITYGNHTWSHMNVGAKKEIVQKEIATADTQLKDRGLNDHKIFAYPYGLENGFAHTVLSEQGYNLGFTTRYGTTMCSKQRLSLPRVRVGDSSLTAYGL